MYFSAATLQSVPAVHAVSLLSLLSVQSPCCPCCPCSQSLPSMKRSRRLKGQPPIEYPLPVWRGKTQSSKHMAMESRQPLPVCGGDAGPAGQVVQLRGPSPKPLTRRRWRRGVFSKVLLRVKDETSSDESEELFFCF